MRRRFGFLLLATLGMVLAIEAERIHARLTELELFKVTAVTVEGLEYLTHDEILTVAAIPGDASLLDETTSIRARIEGHPGVRAVLVRRGWPGRLVLEVEERSPVALLPTPVLTPVDVEGRLLPIRAAEVRLDLPLLRPGRDQAPAGDRLTPLQLRRLAQEVQWLKELDATLLASVSEVGMDQWGDFLLHLAEPRVTLRYSGELTSSRLESALIVLADALQRLPNRRPEVVDLRFADQVVVRFSSQNGR